MAENPYLKGERYCIH
jgi:hypothetical protein